MLIFQLRQDFSPEARKSAFPKVVVSIRSVKLKIEEKTGMEIPDSLAKQIVRQPNPNKAVDEVSKALNVLRSSSGLGTGPAILLRFLSQENIAAEFVKSPERTTKALSALFEAILKAPKSFYENPENVVPPDLRNKISPERFIEIKGKQALAMALTSLPSVSEAFSRNPKKICSKLVSMIDAEGREAVCTMLTLLQNPVIASEFSKSPDQTLAKLLSFVTLFDLTVPWRYSYTLGPTPTQYSFAYFQRNPPSGKVILGVGNALVENPRLSVYLKHIIGYAPDTVPPAMILSHLNGAALESFIKDPERFLRVAAQVIDNFSDSKNVYYTYWIVEDFVKDPSAKFAKIAFEIASVPWGEDILSVLRSRIKEETDRVNSEHRDDILHLGPDYPDYTFFRPEMVPSAKLLTEPEKLIEMIHDKSNWSVKKRDKEKKG